MLTKPDTMSGVRLFSPDYIVDTVSDIDFGLLKKRGIKAVLIDLDGTVVSRGTFDVDKKLVKFLKKQTISIYIATNRPKSRDLRGLKESLNASGVIHPHGTFMKPLPQYFKRAASSHQLKKSEVAMIGDRYLQDIFGANLAGLTTILVRKLGTSEGYIDTILSNFEKRRTDKLSKKYTQ
jgi:HAD superfamily phosphatase (TIGR01668 family)